MLFNGRALIFTFSGTQVRIAEIERLQSLFKMSMLPIDRVETESCAESHVISHVTAESAMFRALAWRQATDVVSAE